MKKQILILISFLFCIASFAMAGVTGKISGRVTDAATGDPLPGANVIVVGTYLGAATDLEGDYYVINLPPGRYAVQASMIGYRTLAQTEALVTVDHTTRVDFGLSSTVLEMGTVEVVAERQVVKMDQTASVISATVEEIMNVPMVADVMEYVQLQAGVEGDLIRGGGLDQTQFMVDGLVMVDNAANRPLWVVNLSAVQELSIILGGFNAEYGNVRSGLINIVTKSGDPNRYHGSVDFRYVVPRLKHNGPSLYDHDNYFLRPYLDPDVSMTGTSNPVAGSPWDPTNTDYNYDGADAHHPVYFRDQYTDFGGWTAFTEENPGMDPEDARNLFIWRHAAEGSEELGHPYPGSYGDKPDLNIDLSLSGPVPVISRFLGNMTFFASFRDNKEMFALPENIDFFHDRSGQVKLTSRVSQSMKLTLEGLWGQITSLGWGGGVPSGVYGGESTFSISSYLTGPSNWNSGRTVYAPFLQYPMDVTRSMMGLSFDHILSPSTFYNFRISRVYVENLSDGWDVTRDTTKLAQFGSFKIDESPYGFPSFGGYLYMYDQMIYGPGSGRYDYTNVNTVAIKFDLTSQINKYHQLKTGFEYTIDDHDTYYFQEAFDLAHNWRVEWAATPRRGGAYIQDKFEFEGIIANLGVRVDFNDPNTEWYTVDVYSKYFSRTWKGDFLEKTPKEKAKGNVNVSPRLGISHPISDVSKLYFNYGHFYSMPNTRSMYQIGYGRKDQGMVFIGNPSQDLARTIAYELGYEHDVGLFRIHLAGYYKDVSDQPGPIRYVNYEGTVDYEITANNNYADVRGFEMRIDKRFGRWITGWFNYDYRVSTEGNIGRRVYYQDPRDQLIYGMQNPEQERPLARPVARGSLRLAIPGDWGPTVAGIKPLGGLETVLLWTWKAGRYQTWEPVEPLTLENNLQWNAEQYFDLRLSKRTSVGGYSFTIFADIKNVFDLRFMSNRGFSSGSDRDYYLQSLHLPMYEDEKYQQEGFISGDDKPGDTGGPGTDKPYIDMPDLNYMTYLNPRTTLIGMQFNF